MRTILIASILVVLGRSSVVAGEEAASEESTVFSGPQLGEELPPVPVRGVFDDDAGKELDFVGAADGNPIVLVFVHQLDRPTIGMARALTAYALHRKKDGLTTGIVWLDDDATEAENTLKRIRHALPRGVPIGLSTDGKEGPGSYGLNRNVALTILVGNEGKVTANFALVQPSIQADLPKVFDAIVQIIGGKAPDVAEFAGPREAMRGRAAAEPDPRLRRLIRPVIQLDATEEEVDKAAAALEAFVTDNEAARQDVGRISKTIVSSGKLANYGTPRAREYLRKWAERYGGESRRSGEKSEYEVSKESSPQAPSR
ncbi:MAG TPA: hypothetical protein VJ828_11470 [Lacipirellulaceae bacterium]|nr:hypothetical protein [Lacipirellulaceae bacterium]